MKKIVKEYAFALLVILAAVGAVYGMAEREEVSAVYAPQVFTTPTPEPTEEPFTEIRRTFLVYFYEDGDYFHVKSGCSGINRELVGRPCGVALDLGLEPCGRCMKRYRIIN